MKRHMFRSIVSSSLVAGITLKCATAYAEPSDDAVPTRPVQQYVQAWFGTTDTHASWNLEDNNGNAMQGTLSELPLGGGIGQRLWGKGFQYGFEGGGLFSWKSDNVDYAGSNNSLLISVDTELFMMDVFMGGIVAARPAPWLRLYAAAGPSVAWGHLPGDHDDDVTDGSEVVVSGPNTFVVIDGDESFSDFSFSIYGRAGLEFVFDNGIALGASIRYAGHEFDFDERGTLKLDDVQWLLTIGAEI